MDDQQCRKLSVEEFASKLELVKTSHFDFFLFFNFEFQVARTRERRKFSSIELEFLQFIFEIIQIIWKLFLFRTQFLLKCAEEEPDGSSKSPSLSFSKAPRAFDEKCVLSEEELISSIASFVLAAQRKADKTIPYRSFFSELNFTGCLVVFTKIFVYCYKTTSEQ